MKELSLNILDIAQNSVKAGAAHIDVSVVDEGNARTVTVTDDGSGMSPEFLASVTDPFTTTRTTRKVGLGIPLLKLAAEQTGGGISIASRQRSAESDAHGTTISATFMLDHLDCEPLGDFASTAAALIQGSPEIDWTFLLATAEGEKRLSTAEMRAVLGDGVPLDAPEVFTFVRDYFNEPFEA